MKNSVNVLNPDLYLNHLPPNKAPQFEIARNLYLVIVGITLWDILLYIPVDVQIVVKGFNIVTFSFMLSRIFPVVYAILFIIIQTHPVTDCKAMSITMHIFCVLSTACPSFLFLRRLHAVYAEKRIIRWIFTILWIGVTTSGIPTFIGIHMEHIPGTDYCTPVKFEKYASIIDFFPAAFDTLVFFAISYRAFGMANEGANWRDIITGRALLPGVFRALLQGGQQYYLTVFGVAIASGAISYAPPSISNAYGMVAGLALTLLTASMACRVFRNLKTLEVDHQSSLLPVTSIRFVPSPSSGDKGDNMAGTMPQEIRISGPHPDKAAPNNSQMFSLDSP